MVAARARAVRGSAGVNYLVLLIVIVVGVVLGNLLSHWLGGLLGHRAGYDLDGLSRSASQARDSAIAQAQKAAGAIASLSDQAREQRRGDREGRRLFAPCDEWRKAHAQLNTATTREEMQRHCGLYERYVEHGVLPGKK